MKVKSKDGFTLVELLGVLVILGIVLGLAVIGTMSLTAQMKKAYYTKLEQSIMMAAGEYYAYQKDMQPVMFGEDKNVELQLLMDGNYIDKVLDRKKNPCNYTKSHVEAYKNSYDKVNYNVCLICPDDEYESDGCTSEKVYTLKMTATIEGSNTPYKEGVWVNQNVILNFKSHNDISQVEVVDLLENKSDCHFDDQRACSIEILESGTYKAHGSAENGNKTKEQSIDILIDKKAPEFDISVMGTPENPIILSYENESVLAKNTISNIRDLEETNGMSGVDVVRYSFEKAEDEEEYISLNVLNNSVEISKELNVGVWVLNVEVIDKAGNSTEKSVYYRVLRKLPEPTSTYCSSVKYDGHEQVLTVPEPMGIYFTENIGQEVGEYQVKANLKENYSWYDNSVDPKTFICKIENGNTTYTIKYVFKENDGVTEKIGETIVKGGLVSEEVTGEVIDYSPNFINPEPQTIILSENPDENVITYLYERKCYGNGCNICSINSKIGQCLVEHQSDLGLWQSNLTNDSSNYRFITTSSASQPKNYVCFGTDNFEKCKQSPYLFRIIGVFSTKNQIRIISNHIAGTSIFQEGSTNNMIYKNSKLYGNISTYTTGKYSAVAGKVNGTNKKWVDMIAARGHGVRLAKTFQGFTPQQMLNLEYSTTTSQQHTFAVVNLKYYPVSLSDLMLASGNKKYTFANNYDDINSSWLSSKSNEWSFHVYNSAYAWVVNNDGKLCGNASELGNCRYSGYYAKDKESNPVSRNYRVSYQLSANTLFCGGSGTKKDPYRIGIGSCTVTGSGKKYS